jgi:hypothetical protein
MQVNAGSVRLSRVVNQERKARRQHPPVRLVVDWTRVRW